MSKIEKLTMACEDMTVVLTLDPKIETDNKSQMRLDLMEAAKLLKSSDMSELKEETIAVLEKLGIELPKPEKSSKPEKPSKPEKSDKPEKSGKTEKKITIGGFVFSLLKNIASTKRKNEASNILTQVKKQFPSAQTTKKCILGYIWMYEKNEK